MKNKNLAIGYLRVSTKKQGESGLGIEDQKKTIMEMAESMGISIIGWYEEHQTATKKKIRIIQNYVIRKCKNEGLIFMSARLDRFARDHKFCIELFESGLDFIFCDCPNAESFELKIRSIFAEQEAKRISDNTRRALAVLKKRGVKLGKPENFSDKGRKKGRDTVRLQALTNMNNLRAYATVKLLLQTKTKRKDIVEYLNTNGFRSSKNNPYTEKMVYKLIKLYEGVNITELVKMNDIENLDVFKLAA